MSISRINFKQLRQENLNFTFAALERALVHLDIPFYLIGALARDTWFVDRGIRALGTKDIDFAIMVPDQHKFEALKNYLVNEEKFTQTSNEYTLRDTQGFEIDLFPFGELNIESRKITDKAGYVHTDITGFQEVFEEATEEVNFENQFDFRVASLAGIVILKLIAWDDRPEMRSDDINDIAEILSNYFKLEETIIFEEHADLFLLEFADMNMLSARVLGREMATVLKRNELLKDRIINILNESGPVIQRNLLIKLFVDESPGPLEYQAEIIAEILKGINEK